MPPDRLRIAIVSTQRGWRGGEIQAALLARGLRDRGHELAVLAAADAPLRHRLAADQFTTRDLTAPTSPLTLTRARRFLRRFKPDILHFNDPRAMSTLGPATAGLGIPARVISRRVDYPLRNPTAYRVLVDALLCVSEAVRQRCAASGVAHGQLYLVPDGVDAGIWHQRGPTSVEMVRPQLLAVGALVADKGHDHLLRAFALLRETHAGVRLAIAGQGPERERLASLSADLGLEQRVVFHGHRDDIPELMRDADLLVHPSLSEGLASVLIEAMFAGLPIVASHTGGIPELLDGSPAPLARLVSPGDATALAAGMSAALTRRRESLEMAVRAQRRAISGYTHQQMIERTLDAYRTTLDRRGWRSGT